MKKTTIWFIAIVLLSAFIGLLAIQFSYLEEIVSTRREQFDDTVKRGLWRVARELERAETASYLEENYNETQRQLLESLSHDGEYGVPANVPNDKVLMARLRRSSSRVRCPTRHGSRLSTCRRDMARARYRTARRRCTIC